MGKANAPVKRVAEHPSRSVVDGSPVTIVNAQPYFTNDAKANAYYVDDATSNRYTTKDT